MAVSPKPEKCLGLLTMAFGKKRHIRQAKTLARSLKLHMPEYPVALVTDRKKEDLEGLFDLIIPVDLERGRGFTQKIFIFEYSPFEETLFIDSDSIVTRSFHEELKGIRVHSFSPIMAPPRVTLHYGDYYKCIEDLDFVLNTINREFLPVFNGGVYYFKNDDFAEKFSATARDILSKYESLGIKTLDAPGPGDEPIYSIAMAIHRLTGYTDDKGSFMRTPVGIESKLDSNPFKGTRFIRYGKEVNPAICHYAHRNRHRPQYAFSAFLLKHPWSKAHAPAVLLVFQIIALIKYLPTNVPRWLLRIPVIARMNRIRNSYFHGAW